MSFVGFYLALVLLAHSIRAMIKCVRGLLSINELITTARVVLFGP